jgi:biotin operon repressor
VNAVANLTPNAQRILDQLYRMASGSQEAAASLTEIAQAAQVSRTLVAMAIRELKAAQAVQQVKGFGQKAHYLLPDPPLVCTSTQKCTLVRTSTSDELNLISDDDEARAQKRNHIMALLGEFLIDEPNRSRLAEILIPLSDHEQRIREECERTLKEHIWRNPRGVMVRRLEALAAGKQDPLPVFADVMATQPERPRRPARTKPTGYRRAG